MKNLKQIDSSRLCEFAILKILTEIGYNTETLSISYSLDEHKELWSGVKKILDSNDNLSDFFVYLNEFLTQFSPYSNKYTFDDVNHVLHYVNVALEMLNNRAVQ